MRVQDVITERVKTLGPAVAAEDALHHRIPHRKSKGAVAAW
jgi:hypothetical protein